MERSEEMLIRIVRTFWAIAWHTSVGLYCGKKGVADFMVSH